MDPAVAAGPKGPALRLALSIALACIAATACARTPEPADLVLQHGRIVTMDSFLPDLPEVKDGSVFYKNQRMTREEALRSYTSVAAYAAFEENRKGSLTLGKLADIVVLSKDIMTIPEDEIPSARVDYTIIGGKVVYTRKQ